MLAPAAPILDQEEALLLGPHNCIRIKASLAHDDVPGAVATWDALPADAKAKSASWGALAKTSADAMSAARALQRDAIIALGAKKS